MSAAIRITQVALLIAFGAGTTWWSQRALEALPGPMVQRSLETDAAAYTRALETGLLSATETVEAAAALTTGRNISLREWDAWAMAAMNRQPALATLTWAPVVKPENRLAFEAAGKVKDPTFEIRDLSAEGGFVRAAKALAWIPLLWISPMDQDPALRGFDLGSRQDIAHALDHASSTMRVAATGQLPKELSLTEEPSVWLLRHVVGPEAFISGKLPVKPFVEAQLKGRPEGLRLTVLDTQAGPQAQPLFQEPGESTLPTAKSFVIVGGRRWSLEWRATQAYIDNHTTAPGPIALRAVLATLAAGVLLMLLPLGMGARGTKG